MELKITRNYQKELYTIGRLYVNGALFSNTLEDPVRDYSNPDYKVYGKTAIPYGRYRVTMAYSPKFSKRYGGRKVPEIQQKIRMGVFLWVRIPKRVE